MIERNPNHSSNYAARWKRLAAEGHDIYGEARLIDAMVPRGSRILDAGCGTGRIGGYLAAQGHQVAGCDLDPVLIQVAQHDYPDCEWLVGDLVQGEVPAGEFDIVVCAGNVVTFLPIDGQVAALKAIAGAMTQHGRAVIGFGAGRGLLFEEFILFAARAGLDLQARYSSWDLQPFTDESDFMVAVFTKRQAQDDPNIMHGFVHS